MKSFFTSLTAGRSGRAAGSAAGNVTVNAGGARPPVAAVPAAAGQPRPGMVGVAGSGTGGTGGGDVVKDVTDRSFMADVIEASMTVPVIVDFWAPWCGPCKQLGPILEKAVRATRGAVRLVKVDTDRNPAIASQLRVQSIPAVYAFFQGRPVDYFVGAVPESQIQQFVVRLAGLAGGQGGGQNDDQAALIEEALTQAREALEAGDPATASSIFGEVLGADPTHAGAFAGLVRCLIVAGDLVRARQMLDKAPPKIAADKEIQAVRTQVELAEQSRNAGPIPELMERLAHDKNDHQIRFDLAMALYAAGKLEAAMDELLEIVRRDREWEEQKARKQLVKLFEAFGATDKLTLIGRRRLSSILFS
ncbi:putative thioredoxin [uncultured Gammaproteobacteria bacterium]